MSPSILESLGIEYIDHLAVTTHDLMATLGAYLRLPGARLVRGPGDNPMQGVRFAFVRLAEGWSLEILAPRSGSQSPIASHVAGGGGPYHFCFAVKALDTSIHNALALGAKLVVEPVEDIAFDGRRVAFLYHPLTGLFELVEALPRSATDMSPIYSPPADIRWALHPGPATSASGLEDLDRRLEAAFRRTFPSASTLPVPSLTLGSIPDWTSLGHLMLIMEVEREFGITVAAQAVAKLDSFAAIREFLKERL
jgi:hypothetical protein